MSNTDNNPLQFEFFSNTSPKKGKQKKSVFTFKCLTLSFENIIVLCIISIMLLVLSFSFGVERGKTSYDFAMDSNRSVIPEEEKFTEERRITVVQGIENTSIEKEVVSSAAETPQEIPRDEPMQEIESSGEEEILEEKIFTVQVASFKLRKSARIEADKLKERGYDIFVLEKGKYSIVCVGKFFQKEEAVEFSGKLKNRYNDCLVRRL